MAKLNKITAAIITKNEEKMLPGCLKTLDWVGETVLIDTGSTDKTVEIAKKHKVKVVNFTKGKNFSDWRNKALKEVNTDWIFYIDADERVPKKLKKEILGKINSSEFSVFAIPRLNIILGKEMRHGGWWPDYVERIFKTKDLNKWEGELHERPSYKGKLKHLENYLIHDKHETFSEMVEKTNNWSAVEAKLMLDANHPPMNMVRFISAMFREFWHRMIIKKAFLDGTEGIIFAIYQVFSRFASYAKLWEIQQKNK